MKLLLYVFLIMPNFMYPFSYDSAIYKTQKGNWQEAHEALNSMITHNPDSADIIYDAGVAAYNLGNKCQAATCFARAAECSKDKHLAVCAHFNAGNIYVDEKNLQSALEEYDKALVIEPDNEYARHNRDRVAQMLQEQEKQKENQQNKDDKQNQDKQENKDQCECDKQNQDKQDQENQDGQDKEQNGANKQQNGNDKKSQNGNDKQQQNQKNDSSQDESLNQQSQGDGQQRDTANGSNNAQRKEHGDKKEQHKNSANNEQRNGKDKLDKKSKDKQAKHDQEQSDQHDTAPGKQHENNDKSNVPGEASQEQRDVANKSHEIAINDPWLLNVLNNQEMHDKAINKQLMEAKIRQHGGKHGQNCW